MTKAELIEKISGDSGVSKALAEKVLNSVTENVSRCLKKGDKIVISGGLHGSVIGLEEKTVLVQIADNVKVKVERGAITAVVREAEPGDK